MTKHGLIAGVNYISHIPGTKCIAVYWEPPTGLLYVAECGDADEKLVPDTAVQICAGQAGKFFDLIKRLLTYHVFHRDE